MKTYTLLALLVATNAFKMNRQPMNPPHLHFNEDPHSVPTPLVNKAYLTSTQARFIAENSTANEESREPKGDQPWHFNYGPYNERDNEYDNTNTIGRMYETREYVQVDDEMMPDDVVFTMTSSVNTWRVTPDYGELDPSVVSREFDVENGKKFSGWTNPLGWTDDGGNDDLVV